MLCYSVPVFQVKRGFGHPSRDGHNQSQLPLLTALVDLRISPKFRLNFNHLAAPGKKSGCSLQAAPTVHCAARPGPHGQRRRLFHPKDTELAVAVAVGREVAVQEVTGNAVATAGTEQDRPVPVGVAHAFLAAQVLALRIVAERH